MKWGHSGVLWEQRAPEKPSSQADYTCYRKQGNDLIQSLGNSQLISYSINTDFWKTCWRRLFHCLYAVSPHLPSHVYLASVSFQLHPNWEKINKYFPHRGLAEKVIPWGLFCATVFQVITWNKGSFQYHKNQKDLGYKIPPEATIRIKRPFLHSCYLRICLAASYFF